MAKGRKFCLECQELGPLCPDHNIRKKQRNGRSGSWLCGECDKERNKANYAANRKAIREHRNSKRYGLTVVEYKELFDATDSSCQVCGEGGTLHVDHDHSTGKVRGLLCQNCNLALGHVKDSIETLRGLIKYLEANE